MKSWADNMSEEMKFDRRLAQKKIDENFLSEEDYKKFRDRLTAIEDYTFTSAEALDAEEPEEITGNISTV